MRAAPSNAGAVGSTVAVANSAIKRREPCAQRVGREPKSLRAAALYTKPPASALLILDPILARQIFDFTRAVSMFLVSKVIFVYGCEAH